MEENVKSLDFGSGAAPAMLWSLSGGLMFPTANITQHQLLWRWEDPAHLCGTGCFSWCLLFPAPSAHSGSNRAVPGPTRISPLYLSGGTPLTRPPTGPAWQSRTNRLGLSGPGPLQRGAASHSSLQESKPRWWDTGYPCSVRQAGPFI